ncbi:MAG: hypothetical protein AAGA65_13875 [Actinomycetota bacterium]
MNLRRRVREFAAREAENNMLAGGDFILPIRRPSGTIVIDLKRTGVIPFGHTIFQLPFGIASRIIWLFGSRTWTVTVDAQKPRSWSRPSRILEYTVDTKAEGQHIAIKQIELATSGRFDKRFH